MSFASITGATSLLKESTKSNPARIIYVLLELVYYGLMV
jgi:hypothetical protein